MHMCHIYCKIKQCIHGDDKSYKLIKIVHVCGKWMVEMKYSFNASLSLLDLDNMRTWLYLFIYFFSLDLHVSNFFSTLGPSWVLFLSLPFFYFFIQPMPIFRDNMESEIISWSFILQMDEMELLTSSVEVQLLACT